MRFSVNQILVRSEKRSWKDAENELNLSHLSEAISNNFLLAQTVLNGDQWKLKYEKKRQFANPICNKKWEKLKSAYYDGLSELNLEIIVKAQLPSFLAQPVLEWRPVEDKILKIKLLKFSQSLIRIGFMGLM
jgi:competence CoiA-like predicted nuclease